MLFAVEVLFQGIEKDGLVVERYRAKVLKVVEVDIAL